MKKINSGESAGGGAILLALQKLRRENVALPSCVWVNSPWTDLSDSLPSKARNHAYDGMLGHDKKGLANHLAVGNRDYFGRATHKNADLQSAGCSPLFGEWAGL